MELFKRVASWFSSRPDAGHEPARAKVRLEEFLSADRVVFFPAGPSKRQVLGHLISLLDLPDPTAALATLLAREEAGSTVIAPGLALPHARMPGVTRLQAAIALCPQGVLDLKADVDPVFIYVLFIGNADDLTQHLAFLARVSAVFQDDSFRQKLLRAGTPERVMDLLRKA